jgi:hypothetical protein
VVSFLDVLKKYVVEEDEEMFQGVEEPWELMPFILGNEINDLDGDV